MPSRSRSVNGFPRPTQDPPDDQAARLRALAADAPADLPAPGPLTLRAVTLAARADRLAAEVTQLCADAGTQDELKFIEPQDIAGAVWALAMRISESEAGQHPTHGG